MIFFLLKTEIKKNNNKPSGVCTNKKKIQKKCVFILIFFRIFF